VLVVVMVAVQVMVAMAMVKNLAFLHNHFGLTAYKSWRIEKQTIGQTSRKAGRNENEFKLRKIVLNMIF
jgi:hypothetical protein